LSKEDFYEMFDCLVLYYEHNSWTKDYIKTIIYEQDYEISSSDEE